MIAPQEMSIQLARSLGNPKKDLANKTIPKIKKTVFERFANIPNIKINPANISIAPKTLTNMFFKLNFYI